MELGIVRDLANNSMQPSRSHAFVTFNNQDSVLMSLFVPKHNLLCLLHDNRIFAFKKTQTSHDDASTSNEQNILLNLLTTPKYRAMSAMYIIFRLLDNISFLLIIVLSIMNGRFTTPTPAHLALLSVIGLEVFYDVMLYTHKYWILQRLSLYIGFVLYGAYYFIVTIKILGGEFTPDDQTIVVTILTIRLIAFILEVCVDIAIDGELHNDLLKLQKCKNKFEVEGQPLEEKISWKQWFKNYMDVRIAVEMPHDVEYEGSFFAWSLYSVFTEKVWTKDTFSRWLVYPLCFFPFIVALLLSILIILLCLVALIFPVLIAFTFAAISLCTCNLNKMKENLDHLKERLILSNFWNELTHF